jgi:hypothetical protein
VVGQADRLFQVMRDQQHADALALNQLGDVLDDAARTIASSEANGSSMSNLGFIASTCASERLRWPTAEMAREAVLEAGEPEPRQPVVGLRQSLARSTPRKPKPSATFSRAASTAAARRPGTACRYRRAPSRIDRARRRLLQADHRPQQARLARAGRADQAHELAFADRDARPSRTGSPP